MTPSVLHQRKRDVYMAWKMNNRPSEHRETPVVRTYFVRWEGQAKMRQALRVALPVM
jgi:hypothetical protein